jgi:DNA invertase Pin-like site-specific DNA recombinase
MDHGFLMNSTLGTDSTNAPEKAISMRRQTADVAIYADKEAMDATTRHGRAMLQMAAVFAELERGMIRERVIAGLERARHETPDGQGWSLPRKPISAPL